MNPLARLHHVTRYSYPHPVVLGPQVVRLRPTPYCRTPILSYELTASPDEHFVNWLQDPNGNWLARFVFTQPTDHLEFDVRLAADMAPVNPFDFWVAESATTWPFQYQDDLRAELAAYLSDAPVDDSVHTLVAEVARTGAGTVDLLTGLDTLVHETVGYESRAEAGVQPPTLTLSRRIGSCRDVAWLLVCALRHSGIGSRFVSGYLVQPQLDGGHSAPRPRSFTPERRRILPGAGWIGLDPTLGKLATRSTSPLPLAPTTSLQRP